MKKLAIGVVAVVALIGTPAFAADMAVKAPPPPPPAPVPSWTGFYGGIQFGGGWSDEAANTNLGNDPAAVSLFGGGLERPPIPSGFRVSQSGAVGGFEGGYNWQAGSNWLLGIETDFSGSGISGTNSATATLFGGEPFTQTYAAQQETNWFGTVRGRMGWLATPNVLLFGTGGFAYGRVSDSANWGISTNLPPGMGFFVTNTVNGVGFACAAGLSGLPVSNTCFAGNSSGVRTGWTAGGGLEWLLDQHWSAKIEYQFVDLGTQTVRVVGQTNAPPVVFTNATIPSSFNAIFHDCFNVVRLGLNYHF